MAVFVVHRLELIKIDHHHAKWFVNVAAIKFNAATGQDFLEMHAVGNTGQAIGVGSFAGFMQFTLQMGDCLQIVAKLFMQAFDSRLHPPGMQDHIVNDFVGLFAGFQGYFRLAQHIAINTQLVAGAGKAGIAIFDNIGKIFHAALKKISRLPVKDIAVVKLQQRFFANRLAGCFDSINHAEDFGVFLGVINEPDMVKFGCRTQPVIAQSIQRCLGIIPVF